MEMCETRMLKEGDSLHRKVVAKAECTKGKAKKIRGDFNTCQLHKT